ncbi:hypothetical protein BRC2024_KCUCJSVR_CDS_0052 [Acinetobacter phage vB_AbaM_KissB]
MFETFLTITCIFISGVVILSFMSRRVDQTVGAFLEMCVNIFKIIVGMDKDSHPVEDEVDPKEEALCEEMLRESLLRECCQLYIQACNRFGVLYYYTYIEQYYREGNLSGMENFLELVFNDLRSGLPFCFIERPFNFEIKEVEGRHELGKKHVWVHTNMKEACEIFIRMCKGYLEGDKDDLLYTMAVKYDVEVNNMKSQGVKNANKRFDENYYLTSSSKTGEVNEGRKGRRFI